MNEFLRFLFCLGLLFSIGMVVVFFIKQPTTIRTHHRLTPRLELIIDSGRVDTMYVYKVELK